MKNKNLAKKTMSKRRVKRTCFQPLSSPRLESGPSKSSSSAVYCKKTQPECKQAILTTMVSTFSRRYVGRGWCSLQRDHRESFSTTTVSTYSRHYGGRGVRAL